MEHDFHAYPIEDVLGARTNRRRLLALEEKCANDLRDWMQGKCVALALSFGKDSMTILHILYKYGLLDDCKIVMWNTTLETKDTLALADYVAGMYPANYVRTVPSEEELRDSLAKVEWDAKAPMGEMVYECIEKKRWAEMDKHGINATILGLRKTESKGRAMHGAVRGQSYWNKREKAQILQPIMNWKTSEVFQYAALEDIPLHPVYDILPKHGQDRMRVRLNTPLSLTYRAKGQLVMLRKVYPLFFARFAELCPAIRNFA